MCQCDPHLHFDPTRRWERHAEFVIWRETYPVMGTQTRPCHTELGLHCVRFTPAFGLQELTDVWSVWHVPVA